MRTIILSAFLALAAASPVLAHSHFESSDPKAGALLTTAPEAVKITFEEALRAKESTITVLDASKKMVNVPSETTVSENDKLLSVPLPQLTAGNYTVKWKAVCMCTDHHITNGSYKFTVK